MILASKLHKYSLSLHVCVYMAGYIQSLLATHISNLERQDEYHKYFIVEE